MMTTQEKAEVLRALRNRDDLEMTRDDLQQLLEAELAKPAEEMDAALVEDLVRLLDEEPERTQQHAWHMTARRLQRRVSTSLERVLRTAAIVLAAVSLAGLTWYAAKAVNDRFLLRQVEQGTHALIVTSNPEVSPDQTAADDGAHTYTRVVYTDLSDCPETLHGYPVVPAWLPEGYSLVSSIWYEDFNMAVVNHHFMRDGQSLIFDVAIYINPGVVVYSETPTSGDDGYESYVSGVPIYFYWHASDEVPCATGFLGSAEYSLAGGGSHEELNLIIESTLTSYKED